MIVLTDGQRFAWRPGERAAGPCCAPAHADARSAADLVDRPRGEPLRAIAPNASVGRLSVSRSLVTPGLPIEVTADVENAGPGAFSGAAELLVDGKPASGSPQAVGPIPAGGRAPLAFPHVACPARLAPAGRSSARAATRLAADDVSAVPVQVAAAIPVLLVNGEPGVEPFSGETDFLRAALAPSGDETPQFRVRVVTPEALDGRSSRGNEGGRPGERRADLAGAIGRARRFRSTPAAEFWSRPATGPIARRSTTPAGCRPSSEAGREAHPTAKPIAHPAPRTFSGPLMSAFGRGDAPALAEAGFFAFTSLEPSPGSAVLARLDTGDPWLVERTAGPRPRAGTRDRHRRRSRHAAGQSRLRPPGSRVGLSPGRRRRSAPGPARRAAGLPARSRAAGRSEDPDVETPSGKKAPAELIRSAGLARAGLTTPPSRASIACPSPPARRNRSTAPWPATPASRT